VTGLVQTTKEKGKSEMLDQLLDVKMAAIELIEKVTALQDENRRLKAEADLRAHLKHVGRVYLLEGHGNADGTYCQVCRDNDQKLIRVYRIDTDDSHGWKCDVCLNFFKDNPSASGVRWVSV
jgi:hypothetical protein